MFGDSRLALLFVSLALAGCALSYEDVEGQRHVVGLYALADETRGMAAPLEEVRHFTFYGLWFDDTFRGTSLALGEIELSVAELRNQWRADDDVQPARDHACWRAMALRWCSFAPGRAARAGEGFDIAVAGLSLGLGPRDRHFGLGYHRQVLLEVTNENALVAWPSGVGLDGLLRGSING